MRRATSTEREKHILLLLQNISCVCQQPEVQLGCAKAKQATGILTYFGHSIYPWTTNPEAFRIQTMDEFLPPSLSFPNCLLGFGWGRLSTGHKLNRYECEVLSSEVSQVGKFPLNVGLYLAND